MALFDNSNIKLDVLKKRAFNYRWAEVPDGVIPLTAADPDYPVAPEIQEAMMDYVKDGYFSYTPKLGYPEFRDSISKALMERKGEEIDPNLILPIDSAARGMYVIAQTVLRQGDEMIVFDPVDYLFRESCLAAGGKVVLFPAKLKDGYIDLSELENYITPKTRMIGLCNPHNPYGVVYRPEDLEHIMSLCEKYNLYIMNDEIWSDIVFPEEPFRSIYSLGSKRCRRVMSVFGFSKSFGIAGLRAGCVYTTDENNNVTEVLKYETKTGAVSTATSETMKGLLEAVVAEGTGHRAYIAGYSIGGKTATSEKLPRSENRYISSFLGFSPADNPQVMTLILIDEPQGIYYGGTIAAPVVGEIYDNILPYLGIYKDENAEEETTQTISIDDAVF